MLHPAYYKEYVKRLWYIKEEYPRELCLMQNLARSIGSTSKDHFESSDFRPPGEAQPEFLGSN